MADKLLSKWGVWGEFKNNKKCWLWYIPQYEDGKSSWNEFGGSTIFCNEKKEAMILKKRWEKDETIKNCKVLKVTLPEG